MKTATPLPPLQPAIDRFREIAAQSDYARLTEGPVHPDHHLLDLCAEALHHLAHAEKARHRLAFLCGSDDPAQQIQAREDDRRRHADYQEGELRGKYPIARITKIEAKTAAGIYAKAMVVRASRTGAALLAMSLARDLIACPGLRESLWPATQGE
jgi:hypothetical protein